MIPSTFIYFLFVTAKAIEGKKEEKKWLFRDKQEYWMRKGNKYRNMRVLFPRELGKVEMSST